MITNSEGSSWKARWCVANGNWQEYDKVCQKFHGQSTP